MFGSLGLPEILFILVIALLVFGPKRLPEIGRTLGKGLREFRRATTDLKRSVEVEMSRVDEPEAKSAPPAPSAGEPEPRPEAGEPQPRPEAGEPEPRPEAEEPPAPVGSDRANG